jgi:PAS domain S-box-containing protein
MINFIKKYWKKGLDIGRQNNLHYLEKQRVAILNAISLLVISASLIFTFFYILLDYKYYLIALIILPFCLLVLWFNHKAHYKIAKNTAFFGVLFSIIVWCFVTRNTGSHYFLIALGCGVASIYKDKKAIFGFMILSAVLFTAYCYWNWVTPIVLDPNVNYDLLNFTQIFVSSAIIFFQIMVHLDINRSISKSHDRQLFEKNEAIQNLKITEEKLKTSNSELLSFNNKLDKLVKKSSEELYSFQAAINDNLYSIVTDLEGKIIKINDNYLEKTGYTKQEVIGKPISLLQSNFHSNAFYENINKTIYAGKVWRGESKIKTKTGNDFWLVSSIMPFKTNTGLVKSFLTVSSDITEKKQAQEHAQNATINLAKTEDKLTMILQNLSDLIVITDKLGNRKYVNIAFCEFFGKEATEFIGTNYRNQKPEKISKAYLRLFDSISFENPKISFLDVLTNFKNEKRWIIWKEMAVFDTNKDITEIFSIGHDITDIKEIEFQNANFIAQFEEIAFKTSHNFRGPLTSIMGLISMIKDDGFEEKEMKQVATYMKGAIDNLDKASRELANFIEKYNTEKIDLRTSTNIYDFEEAKLKHLNWRFKIRNYIDGIGSMTKNEATSQQHSELGKWYFNEGKSIYGHIVSMQEFESEQEKLHNLVLEIIDLKEKNETVQSEVKFLELDRTSDKIIILLDEVEAEVRKYVLKN